MISLFLLGGLAWGALCPAPYSTPLSERPRGQWEWGRYLNIRDLRGLVWTMDPFDSLVKLTEPFQKFIFKKIKYLDLQRRPIAVKYNYQILLENPN